MGEANSTDQANGKNGQMKTISLTGNDAATTTMMMPLFDCRLQCETILKQKQTKMPGKKTVANVADVDVDAS